MYFPAQQNLRLKIYSKQYLKIAIHVGFSPEYFYACYLQELTTSKSRHNISQLTQRKAGHIMIRMHM